MIIKKKLNCGAETVIEKVSSVRSAAIGIWVRTGSVNEKAETLGMSHYIEHMLFKGTDERSARQIAGDIDKIGGQINAFTGKESTCYYVKTLDTHVEEAADVLFDLFFNSKFDPAEMEKEKNVIYEEISMHEDSPEEAIHDMLYEELFKESPLGTPILGTRKTLEGFTRDKVLDYYVNNYTMDSIVISAAGNIDEDELTGIFEKKFKKLRPKKNEIALYPDAYSPNYRMKKKDIEQTHICLGIKGVTLDHDKYYALSVLNNIMGGSMSSRLFQSIREEKGMAYSVYSYTTSYVNDGLYAIYAGVNPQNAEEAVKLIINEIDILKRKGITEEEFSAAREQLKGNYIFGLENVNSRMASLGKSQLLLGKIYTPEEVLQHINDVTMDDMRDVINLISDLKNYSAVAIGKKEIDIKSLIAG